MDSNRRGKAIRISSIDIGTNTLLLLIADFDQTGRCTPVHHEQRFPRIGHTVDASGQISISAFDRTAWILNEYKNLARQFRSDLIVACATSAVRDASNKTEFLTYLRETTGLQIELLSGEAEANLTYRGTVSDMRNKIDITAVVDIGGGSTEIIIPDDPEHPATIQKTSIQLGSVRIKERCFNNDPPTLNELAEGRNYIRTTLSEIQFPSLRSGSPVGVAGTVTTLACLDLQLKKFDPDLVDGYRLSRQTVREWSATLAGMSSNEISSLSDATMGRADILSAGAIILDELMSHFQFIEIIASIRGLRYGFALAAWERLTGIATF